LGFRQIRFSETQRTRGHEESRALTAPALFSLGTRTASGLPRRPYPNGRLARTPVRRFASSRSFTLQPISRTWLRYRCGFDLYQNVRMIKACDTEKRAYLTTPTLCEAVFNLGRSRFQGAIDIRGVEVQTDHIRHLEPGIIQNRFQVIQALGYLGAHVPGWSGFPSASTETCPAQ